MNAFFDGKWQFNGEPVRVIDPYTGEGIEEVPNCGSEILDSALESLASGRKVFDTMDRVEHHAIFERFFQFASEAGGELAELIVREQGKCMEEAKREVHSMLVSAELLADNPSLVGARILPLANEASIGDRYGYTVRHPHGVVAVICPNPQPLVLPAVNTLYALAAGNAVVLKPSIHAPLVSIRLVELLLESGCPPEAIACLTGFGSEIGRAIGKHRLVNHLVCAGSLSTIQNLRSEMEFVTSQLQWGCVATCVIGKSANVSIVADEILRVAFECSGQAAFTPTWIACFEETHDDLRDLLKERFEKLRTGNPLEPDTEIGPLVEQARVDDLEERIASEKEWGAEVVTGGKVEGLLWKPVLMDGCSLERTRFSKEEICAPIIGMTAISRARDATDLLRDQRHHVLTLFSNDEDWAARQAMRMPFNNVHINGIPTWRDGLICLPGNPTRTGRRSASDRVSDMSHVRDVIFH